MSSLLGLEVSSHVQTVLDIMPRYRNSTWWKLCLIDSRTESQWALEHMLNRAELNEWKLGVAHPLQAFAKDYGPVAEKQTEQLSHGDFVIRLAFDNYDIMETEYNDREGNILKIISKENANVFVSFDMQHVETPHEIRIIKFTQGVSIPFNGSKFDQWMGETVQRLVELGSLAERVFKEIRGLCMLSRNDKGEGGVGFIYQS